MLIATLLASLAPALPQDPPASPFRALDLTQALEAARAEDKAALVYFRAAGVVPCQRLERETLGDASLTRWLVDHVVAIQVDVGSAGDLPQRFALEGTPALVFLLASGDELDRLVGFRPAVEVFAEAEKILKGGEKLAEARREFVAKAATPLAHAKFARVLAGLERHEAALERYLWAWDNGVFDPSFARDRALILPKEIEGLAQRYRPAKRALVERRDAAVLKLRALTEGDDWVQLARDYGSLNLGLGRERDTLRTFDELREGGKAPQPVLGALLDGGVAPLLAVDGRFADLLAARGDVLAHAELLLGQYLRDVAEATAFAEAAQRAGATESVEPALRAADVRRNQTVSECATYCEALVSTGAKDTARELATRVGRAIPRARTWLVLARGAINGGDPELGRQIGELGLGLLTDPDEKSELEAGLARSKDNKR